MKKIGTRGGRKMQQQSWAFLVIFLGSCFIFTKVQASYQTEPVQKPQSLIELNEDNWRQMFKGEWMIKL